MFATAETATRKLVAKVAGKYDKLTFCYEAGPTGYGLHRLIKSLDHGCVVVAPSLIPKKPGTRVKTNRRDAVSLAKLLRAGELTAVLGTRRATQGHARPLACTSGGEEGPAGQAPADLVVDRQATIWARLSDRLLRTLHALTFLTHPSQKLFERHALLAMLELLRHEPRS